MSGAGVAESAERLLEAGARLRARSATRTLDALCRWVEGWRDAGSPWRRRLEDALPGATGFTPEVVREGLALGLRDWSGDALRDVVEGELRSAARAAHPAVVSGFDLTGVVLAGSIPMPTLLAMALPLVLHSPVLARSASRDPVTPELAAETLAEVDPLLGECIEVVSYPHDDEASAAALLEADCIVATGSDETVEAIARRVPPGRRLVRYGHRLSLAALGPAATRGEALARAARGLALDVALWDQLGCLSPVAVFVEDADPAASERVAASVAAALEALGERLPRGALPPAASAAVARERDEAELRAGDADARDAGPRRAGVHRVEGAGATVVLERDAHWRPAPLHRFLRVVPVGGRAELLAALAPVARHLAAVATAGFGSDDEALGQALGQLGASRVCRPGAMQAPPLGWHHDGQPLLLPLALICDLERP